MKSEKKRNRFRQSFSSLKNLLLNDFAMVSFIQSGGGKILLDSLEKLSSVRIESIEEARAILAGIDCLKIVAQSAVGRNFILDNKNSGKSILKK